MFDSAPKTPKHTSWTMDLLARIDQAVGHGVWDSPIFPNENAKEKKVPATNSEHMADIAAGKYDGLFKDAPDRPSDLYRAAQIPAAVPTVRLLSSSPLSPERFVTPQYPPLAKLAHLEGTVSFTININEDGSTKDFSVSSGHPMLRPAVQEAADGWKFSKDSAGQRVHAIVEFATNCPTKRTD
jgi:TonB family protein